MKRIFILEDSNDRILLYKKIYKDCVCIIVKTAKEAIDLLSRDTEFDLITLDHDLGGEVYCSSDENSGYAVAEYLSKHLLTCKVDCPIVIHSWNPAGAHNMAQVLPHAIRIPFSAARLI